MRPFRSLTRPADFRRVTRTGSRTRRDGLTLFVLPAEETRLGVAVRGAGAVTRNRIKRRLRAAAAEGISKPVHVVVRADEGAARVEFQELVMTFTRASERV